MYEDVLSRFLLNIVLTRHHSKSKMKWLWFSRSHGHLLVARNYLSVPLEWVKSYTCVVRWLYYVQQLLKTAQRLVVYYTSWSVSRSLPFSPDSALCCLGSWYFHYSEHKGVYKCRCQGKVCIWLATWGCGQGNSFSFALFLPNLCCFFSKYLSWVILDSNIYKKNSELPLLPSG